MPNVIVCAVAIIEMASLNKDNNRLEVLIEKFFGRLDEILFLGQIPFCAFLAKRLLLKSAPPPLDGARLRAQLRRDASVGRAGYGSDASVGGDAAAGTRQGRGGDAAATRRRRGGGDAAATRRGRGGDADRSAETRRVRKETAAGTYSSRGAGNCRKRSTTATTRSTR